MVWQQVFQDASGLHRLPCRTRGLTNEDVVEFLKTKRQPRAKESRKGARWAIDAMRDLPGPGSHCQLTAPTPPAHELSMESSAERPPKLAPVITLVGTPNDRHVNEAGDERGKSALHTGDDHDDTCLAQIVLMRERPMDATTPMSASKPHARSHDAGRERRLLRLCHVTRPGTGNDDATRARLGHASTSPSVIPSTDARDDRRRAAPERSNQRASGMCPCTIGAASALTRVAMTTP